jgi:hypothetical protein
MNRVCLHERLDRDLGALSAERGQLFGVLGVGIADAMLQPFVGIAVVHLRSMSTHGGRPSFPASVLGVGGPRGLVRDL